MVLLPKITEDAIVDNLRKRYMDDYIFVSFSFNFSLWTNSDNTQFLSFMNIFVRAIHIR